MFSLQYIEFSTPGDGIFVFEDASDEVLQLGNPFLLDGFDPGIQPL